MNFDQLVQSVMQDTIGARASLWAFRPEMALCATIVAVLLARTIAPRWTTGAFYLTLAGLCAAIHFAVPWHWLSDTIPAATPTFTGTLQSDSFTVVLRGLLLLFAILFTTFTQIAEKRDRFAYSERPAQSEPVPLFQDDTTEFYVLMLGALVGMCLMISANHILIVMLGVEMASVPCYVLAGMQRNRSKSSEAALKYAVFGAGTAGVMLYGLSLLAGVLGWRTCPP